MENKFFNKIDNMALVQRFHFIAFDCEGRLCSECQWRDEDKDRCIKRDTMREVKSLLQETLNTNG